MIEYDPDLHETLLVHWYYSSLVAEPEEFANLFAKPLRNLTEILHWAKHSVKLIFESDGTIWIAAWILPEMSGAWFGLWVRKDKRQTRAMLAFVDECLDAALERFPVLMALTKQPRLQSEIERLGFVHQGATPHLFDGAPANAYYLTKETRDGRRRRKDQHGHADQSLRSSVVGDGEAALQYDPTGLAKPVEQYQPVATNWRGKLKYPINKSGSGRQPRSDQPIKRKLKAKPRKGRARKQQLRAVPVESVHPELGGENSADRA